MINPAFFEAAFLIGRKKRPCILGGSIPAADADLNAAFERPRLHDSTLLAAKAAFGCLFYLQLLF